MGSDILSIASRGRRHEPDIFPGVHKAGNGATGFLEAGEVPQVRKVPALLRFHRLNRAITAVKEHALSVVFFCQRKPASIFREAGEALDEFDFTHALEGGQPRHFTVRQAYLAGPPAAGGATLALVKDRHTRRI
jgi:hypothetical protein